VRVLLLSANRLRFPYPVYPIGLDVVAGALAPAHEVRILDLCPLEAGAVEGAILAEVGAFSPGAIGISVRNVDNTDATHSRSYTEDVAAIVRTLRGATQAPIVLGGAGYTLYPAEMLQATGADWGVVGEGERARTLFDALAEGRDPSSLPGVARRGGPAPEPSPIPPANIAGRAGAPLNPALGFYLSRGAILNLQTQRGCGFQCAYCTYPAIEGHRFRRRAVDDVAREAKRLEEAGARFLFLTDSVFNADPDHCLAVAEAFERVALSVPWGAFFAPLTPPPGFYERMARAGCTHAEFGTEALSDAMLARIRKSFRRADVLRAHRAAVDAGIHVAHFMLLGGPDEDDRTLEETLAGAELLDRAALFFFCGMRIFRGTELERMARASGQIAPEERLLAPVFYEPPSLPLSEIAERVRRHARGRTSWVVGSGEERSEPLLQRMYERGHTGPLWERLVGA
jgi:radical SAM superfamily enzyme YgiQ (UPF0313 family)